MQLSGKQRRYLRSLGHKLEPVVHIGKGGITDGLVGAVNQALEDHELIKIRLLEDSPIERSEAADAVAGRCQAAVVQTIGRAILLYRPRPDNPEIFLPGKRDEPAGSASPVSAPPSR